MTVRPAQSTTWSPGRTSGPPPTRTDSMTEPRSTTSAGTGGAPEPSKTLPLTKRVRWPGDCEGTGASGMSGSDHVVPAVGHKIAAGDVIGVLAGQEERGAGHLFRLGDVVHRGHRAQRVAAAVLVVLAAQHPLGLHEPGCEHVDPHLGREGVRVGLGEADDAVLGGGVLRRPGAAAHDDGRADVDDRPAAALLEHARAELVRADQRALDVDGEGVVDRLLGDVPPRHLLARHVPHVFDQHVEPPEVVEYQVGHGLDLRPVGDVGPHEEGLAPRGLDARGGLPRASLRAAVVHGDVGALLRRAHRDLGAEAGACAGDQDSLASEPLGERHVTGGPYYTRVRPPSAYMTWPVTNADCAEQRKRIGPARAATGPSPPAGTSAVMPARTPGLSRWARVSSVSV